ncbi:hypothetical protein [Oryzihumus sp.]
MSRTLTALPRHGLPRHVLLHHLPGFVTPGPQHAIGIPLAFGALVTFFGVVLGLMMLTGHLRHQRRNKD